jgi:hypothetical protein
VFSTCPGMFTDLWPSERAGKLLSQKEFLYSIAAGDSLVLTGPTLL